MIETQAVTLVRPGFGARRRRNLAAVPSPVFNRNLSDPALPPMKKLAIRIAAGIVIFGAGLLIGTTDQFDIPMSADAQTADRIFEIRTYTTHPGKLEDLHRRFRDHTMRLFERHGMTNIGYWVPQDAERSSNTLVYILAYPSRAVADSAWVAFRADPEWQAAKAASEADGPIVERVESVFLDPATYSPIR